MYSKAGRATTEMFTALQHGSDLFEAKPKNTKVFSSLQSANTSDKLSELVAKKFGQNGLLKDLAGIMEVDDTAHKPEASKRFFSKSPQGGKKFEPFSQFVSRDKREKVLSFKKVSSGAAYYSPKYDHIEKRNPILVDYSKVSTKRMFDDLIFSHEVQSAKNETTRGSELVLPPIADKPSGKVKGAIPFDLQVARPDILKEIQKRKICLTDSLPNPELPSTLSSVQRLPRIKFSRSLPRKDLEAELATSHCPTYSPNYEFIKKSLGHVGAEHSKVMGRKPIVKEPYYTFETFYDYDGYVKNNKSNVFPKVIYPSFDKMPPRERNHETKSSALLQSMNSKISEQDLYHKSEGINKSQFKSYVPQSIDTSMLSTVLQTRT